MKMLLNTLRKSNISYKMLFNNQTSGSINRLAKAIRVRPFALEGALEHRWRIASDLLRNGEAQGSKGQSSLRQPQNRKAGYN